MYPCILFTSSTSLCWPTLYVFFLVYIFEIAMLIDIESTSCLRCAFNILLTSSALSILQYWPTLLSRHRVYIVWLLSCLHQWHVNVDRHSVYIITFISSIYRWHCRYHNVDQHRHCVYIMFLLSRLYFRRLDIALLIDIKSTSWLRCTFFVVYGVTLKKYMRWKQCKLNVCLTSYTMRNR